MARTVADMATKGGLLSALPDEVAALVLGKLEPWELSDVRLVSKRFAALGKQPTLASLQQQLQMALDVCRRDHGAGMQKLLDDPAAQDAMVHMQTLSLHGDTGRNTLFRPLEVSVLQALLRCRQRGMRLRRLVFINYDLSDEAAMALLFGPSRLLEGVEGLAFEQCEWFDCSLRELAACAHLAALRSLRLDQSVSWDEASFAVLAASPSLRNLQSLSFETCDAYWHTLSALFEPPGLESLTSLRLVDNILSEYWPDNERELLPLSPRPAGRAATLTELCLCNTSLAAAHVAGLVKFPALARLTHLDLSMNKLGSDGAAHVAAAPVLQRLKKLNLTNCQVGDGGAHALAGTRTLTGLTDLMLDDNGLGDEAAAALAVSEGLRCLVRLTLRFNRGVSDEGTMLLQQSPVLTALQSLVTAWESLRDDCDSPYFPC